MNKFVSVNLFSVKIKICAEIESIFHILHSSNCAFIKSAPYGLRSDFCSLSKMAPITVKSRIDMPIRCIIAKNVQKRLH